MIAPISGALPSGEGLVEGLKKTLAEIAFIVPSIVQDLAQNPNLLDYCAKNLELLIYCGGDLPQAIGDVIASKTRLVNQFGASELGLTPNLLSKRIEAQKIGSMSSSTQSLVLSCAMSRTESMNCTRCVTQG